MKGDVNAITNFSFRIETVYFPFRLMLTSLNTGDLYQFGFWFLFLSIVGFPWEGKGSHSVPIETVALVFITQAVHFSLKSFSLWDHCMT